MIVYLRPPVPLLAAAGRLRTELPILNLITSTVGGSRRERLPATPAPAVKPESRQGQNMPTNEAGMSCGMSGFSGNFALRPVESLRPAVYMGTIGEKTRKEHPHPQSSNVAWNQRHRSKDGVHSCKDNHIRKTRMSHGINSIGQKWGQNVMKKHPHPLSWNVTWNQQDRSKMGARP